MISLLLHESEAKPWMIINKKDIIRMYLGYNWLITQKTSVSHQLWSLKIHWLLNRPQFNQCVTN